jgi:hypothetical protein
MKQRKRDQTTSLASDSVPPVTPAFSSLPPEVFAASADLNACSKSAIISSMYSVPTEIRMRSYKVSMPSAFCITAVLPQ